ncbi:MAG: dihydrofolate reductase, partial [Lachnospiraceae bacterium]|nr:dihydrofolate reductase [Lachnospiraceae bacterium]
CDTCLITKLDKEFQADTFFPVLEDHGFSISEESDEYTYDDIKFKFLTYRKNMR